MTLTPATKKKLLDIARTLVFSSGRLEYDYLQEIIGTEHANQIFREIDKIKSPKLLARVIRRFVRTGVLEFKKSEVKV